MFQTPYNRKVVDYGEVNSGKIVVETAGYISPKKQIETLMLAGQRLAQYRASQSEYDFPDGKIDEGFVDPTRSPGFDMADASQLAMQAEANLKAAQAAYEAAKAAEKPMEAPIEPPQ